MTLPIFPFHRQLDTPDFQLPHGITLQAATMADIDFLRQLYYQSREDELAQVPWPLPQKKLFLDNQFDLQHRHYLSYYPDADFLLVKHQGNAIGRFYLLRRARWFLLIDISLLLSWRNQGIGSQLIRYAQTTAQAANAALDLHVDQRNSAAQELYDRLGFVHTHTEGVYIGMRWTANHAESSMLIKNSLV